MTEGEARLKLTTAELLLHEAVIGPKIFGPASEALLILSRTLNEFMESGLEWTKGAGEEPA